MKNVLSARGAAPVRLLPLACAVAATLGTALPAAAQSSIYPYFLRASETLTYDSNLFRVPKERGESSDVISTTALTVGFEQPIGRQRVNAAATVSKNFYRSNGDLDNVGYSLTAGLDWEAFSKWSGSVRVGATQGQTSFDQYGALSESVRTRNLERSQTIDLRAQYGGPAILSAEFLANYTHVNYSSQAFENRAQRSHMIGAGLRYHPGGFWTLGVTVRDTKGSYPSFATVGDGVIVGDDYDRVDYDLTANYQATGYSSLNARLTFTRENHQRENARDFNGVTGAIGWNYQLSGKVTTSLTYSRNTGTGASYASTPAVVETGGVTQPVVPVNTSTTYLTDSQLTDQITGQAVWAATAKVSVTGGFSYSRDRYDNSFVLAGAQSAGNGRGNSKQLYLSSSYAITRIWSATCGVSHLSRASGVVVAGVNYEYSANTAYCTAQLSLR